ncbi:YdeI/OmpD-associated family protein [Pedobacter sp.]|uniref:YdeI/OmpD-associated family protein n=1 Tax=Pedobacter sp. TaxID=1411316 RepID=UPI003D7FAC9F
MVTFNAEIEKFEQMGEKTGWTYVFIPREIAYQIKPDCKKSFRVKGRLDNLAIHGLALTPMGDGDFILALKTSLRKQLKKEQGAMLSLELADDVEFKIEMPEELAICLSDDPKWMAHFVSMPKSHQHYYINWFNTAKTEKTKLKRLTMIVNAMEQGLDFGAMIRAAKA